MTSFLRWRIVLLGWMLVTACGAPPPPPPPPTSTLPPPQTTTPPPPTVTQSPPPTMTSLPPTATSVPEVCRERAVPTGKAPGSNELQPGGTQLRMATSPDGMTWTRVPDALIDQSATPSLARRADGQLLLYMTAHGGKSQDAFTVSLGSADGLTWTHCDAIRQGFPQWLTGTDPDVVPLPNGAGFRIFMTGSITAGSRQVGIHYADSSDGITWQYGGIALQRAEQPIIDSMTFIIGDTWHMYALDGQSISMMHATSHNGKTFAIVDSAKRTIAGKPHVLSQAVMVGDTMRIYGFGPRGMEIRSFTTTDGATLVADTQLLLALDDARGEHIFIKDPAVVQLNDGTYLMVYATAIP